MRALPCKRVADPLEVKTEGYELWIKGLIYLYVYAYNQESVWYLLPFFLAGMQFYCYYLNKFYHDPMSCENCSFVAQNLAFSDIAVVIPKFDIT